MADNEKFVPMIRFKGFDNTWEQRKLGEVAELSFGGGTPSTANNEFWNGDIPWLQSSDLTEHDVARVNLRKYITQKGLESSAAKLIPAKSIAIVARVGVGKLGLIPFQYTTSQDFISLSKLNVDSWFGVYIIYKKLQKEINSVQGTSIKGITKVELFNKTINIPVHILEQTAIGNFFRTLDDTIALYKRKLDGLKALKRGYLQQMFPQAGESMPRVRFAGFSGDWEERKLGEVFEQTAEYVNPKEENIELWSLTVESGLTPKTERYNRAFLVKKEDAFKSVSPEEFIYNPMNMTLGAIDLNTLDKKVAVSGYYITMRIQKNHYNKFFAVWLKSSRAIKLYKLYATGGLLEKQRVQFPTLSQIETFVPTLEEQTLIGNFFHRIDEQIAAQAQKLEQIKQLKASYLQKMFV